jgi:hypothetical protein
MRGIVAAVLLSVACAQSSPKSTVSPVSAPSKEAVVKVHPVLGQAVRLEVHRYRPDAVSPVTDPARIAAFAAAVAPEGGEATSMPRTMPAEEVIFLDAGGASLGAVVFLGADDTGFVNVRGAGTRTLTAAEAQAVRALLAEVK